MSKLIYFRDWKGEKIESKSFEFNEGDEPLVDFFNDQVKDCVEGRVSTVKVMYNEKDEFVGYYAIAMSYIESGDLYDEKRVTTFPHPAIKLGRLDRDNDGIPCESICG